MRPACPGLERVLKSFPNVDFIGHGPGFWASISGELTARDMGGYPVGPVKPGGALDRLFDAIPIFGAISRRLGLPALRARPRVRPAVPDPACRSTPVRHGLPQAGPGRASVRGAGRFRPASAGPGENRTPQRFEITGINPLITPAGSIIPEDLLESRGVVRGKRPTRRWNGCAARSTSCERGWLRTPEQPEWTVSAG